MSWIRVLLLLLATALIGLACERACDPPVPDPAAAPTDEVAAPVQAIAPAPAELPPPVVAPAPPAVEQPAPEPAATPPSPPVTEVAPPDPSTKAPDVAAQLQATGQTSHPMVPPLWRNLPPPLC